FSGGGSQAGGLSRWGDYTSMSVDPSDDCTFWYTDQYLSTSGRFNWRTRVGTFSLPGCASSSTPTVPVAPTLSATAGRGVVHLSWTAPSNGGSTITNYKVYRGATSGGESLLTTLGNVTTYGDAAVSAGTTYYYEVSAVNGVGEGAMSNEASATPSAPASFSLSASPASRTVVHGGTTTYAVTITRQNGFTASV